MHCKQIKLNDVWRTCNKIRAAIFRTGLNLWTYFIPHDPNKNGLISESLFLQIFTEQLQKLVGLSDQEICELSNYFRVSDGRVFYTQMCDVICSKKPHFSNNAPLVSGLEWNDPLDVNRVSPSELRRLNLLLTKIATIVNMRRLILRPYFQDYELVAKNNGAVTISHFARILNYLNILLSPDDFNLLLKRYVKNGYALNYIAFLKDIYDISDYMDKHGVFDLGGDILSLFPGKLINAELPKLPRPEIGKISALRIFGTQDTFHPATEEPKANQDLITVMRRVQRHVLENRIRVNEFFRDYDGLNTGKITQSQFIRGLDNLGISGLHRLYLSHPEIESILIQYRDPCDDTLICWKTFEDDVDQIFTIKELEKHPNIEIPFKGDSMSEFATNEPQSENICDTALIKIKRRLASRRMLLRPIFRDHDKHCSGYVTRSQMRQCVLASGIPLTSNELLALEDKYNNESGFNYIMFLDAVEPEEKDIFACKQGHGDMHLDRPKKHPTPEEKNIVLVLAKIKGKVVRERIRVSEFMRSFDTHNRHVISKDEFARGLSSCRFDLSEYEVETLMNVFASPLRNDSIDYKRFCGTVDEAFTQPELERTPLVVPVQHLPVKDSYRNFLNFGERQTLTLAMQKLSKWPELKLNLMSLFQDYDKYNCGTVSESNFLRALSLRGIFNIITMNEFEVICKCFGVERGMRNEIDYRNFIRGLDYVHCIEDHKPF